DGLNIKKSSEALIFWEKTVNVGYEDRNFQEATQKEESFTLLNLNVQSITNKRDLLSEFLLQEIVAIACITEHWLAAGNTNTFNLRGYEVARCYTRTNSTHAGVMILTAVGTTFEPVDMIEKLSVDRHIEMCLAKSLAPENAINLDESKRIFNDVPVVGSGAMMLFEVTEEEIIAEVSRMKPRTSRDIYGFSVILLKRIITTIVPPLCVLVN
ncbi:hypothetical protein HHI36_003863, partial [Cryptolaemus montrouzieri]